MNRSDRPDSTSAARSRESYLEDDEPDGFGDVLDDFAELPDTLARLNALTILVRGLALREPDDPLLGVIARAVKRIAELHLHDSRRIALAEDAG
ncbi:MAG TPA: hypothetical protein VD838_16220 [Anaeromyxobacteraceae bacterium]|nr:hypothetical protein [Anaeromyxobacteraceae bacterium]